MSMKKRLLLRNPVDKVRDVEGIYVFHKGLYEAVYKRLKGL